METVLYIVISVAVLGALYWFFVRKPTPEQLPEAQGPKQLEKKPEPKAEPKKPEPKKPEPKKPEPKKLEAESEPKKPEEPAKQKEEPKPAKTEGATQQDAKTEPEEPTAAAQDKTGDETKSEAGAVATEQVAPTEQGTGPAAVEKEAPEPAPAVGEALAPTPVARRERDVEGLRKGLGKSRAKEGFFGRLAKLITGSKEIAPEIVDELEEVLITSDVGVQTTRAILDRLRDGLKKKELDDQEKVWGAFRAEARRILGVGDGGLTLRTRPTVVLMVGVNGSGKTTTIGKLATQLKADGRKVILAAGDTFRAAAVQQLEVWARRVGCEIVKGKDGADPGAVIFEAIQKAVATGADVVLADTAGRLHTKAPLMDELKKVVRTMGKALQGAPHETLLVIDATNGQNAMAQSRQFAEALTLTGVVLTKLDGTAKGGVVLGICDELKLPVRYIGIGERAEDLRKFDAEEFVEALLGTGDGSDEAAA
jgi:fused signal recognition particle receptor